MSLKDLTIRTTKPREKAYKLADEKGLYLHVFPNGSKYWRFKYYFADKPRVLALGVYPEVTLAEARDKRDLARKQVADGRDPGMLKKLNKRSIKTAAENSFRAIAIEWCTKFSAKWTEDHRNKILRKLEKDVFPWLGNRPISEITAPELLLVLRRIEDRGALETAHRTHQICSQIFRYAIASGRAERDPCGDLRGALAPVRKKHHASITDPKKVGDLLRALNSYEGYFVTKCALRLSPLPRGVT